MSTTTLHRIVIGAACLTAAACGVAVGTPEESRPGTSSVDATAFAEPLDMENRTVRTATFALG